MPLIPLQPTRPFSPPFYRTPVTHVPRVVVAADGEEEETWPGPGTVLFAAIIQGNPKDRYTQSVEETITAWTLWFDYQAVIDAGVTILRGDQLRIAQANGRPTIVLRANAHALDYNQLGIAWVATCQQVD